MESTRERTVLLKIAKKYSFGVALLTSGPVSDAGWYGSAYEGIQLIEERFDARISHQQTTTPAEFDEVLRAYATSGYSLIFAHGFEYQERPVHHWRTSFNKNGKQILAIQQWPVY